MTWTEEKHNYHGNSNVSSAALSASLSRMSWQREIFFYAKAEATKRWMSPYSTQHNGQNISEWVPRLYTSWGKEWVYRSFIEAGMLSNTSSYYFGPLWKRNNALSNKITANENMCDVCPQKVFGFLSHTSLWMNVLYLKTNIKPSGIYLIEIWCTFKAQY